MTRIADRDGPRVRRAVLVVIVAVASSGCGGDGSASVTFTEVAEAAGLRHTHGEPRTPPRCRVELPIPPVLASGEDVDRCEVDLFAGGAAVADFDVDGSPDVYLTRLDGPGRLYRNDGAGTFTDVTEPAGLGVVPGPTNGAAWADLDNSGFPDLFVTGFGTERSYLFMNNGDGTFREEAEARGVAMATGAQQIGFSVTVGDFDGDGWVDIHTNEWWPAGLGGHDVSHTRLFRNRGAEAPAHFEDVTAEAGVEFDAAAPDLWAFASAFGDLDGDGHPDLAIVGDFGTSRLFWNRGDGTFTEGTANAGVGTDENGMGSTFGDYDNSGRLDWFVSSIFDTERSCEDAECHWGYSGNRLYRNEGDRTFTDVTDDAGVRDGGWGWGAGFFDADNDGWLDLVMTNGIDTRGLGFGEHFAEYPKQLWMNDGAGSFDERAQAAGITATAPGTGLVIFDADNDGWLDVLMVQNAGPPLLYRNGTDNGNGWLRVDVEGRDSNRDGLGAVVRVRTTPDAPQQMRVIGSTTQFLGQSERIAHFGLGRGDEPVAELHVEFPATGREVVLQDVGRDQLVHVVEPED